MSKERLLERLNKVEQIACATKWSRLFHNPYKYISAIFFRKFTYAKTHQEKIVHTPAFFGGDMIIALPAATDIYLTGGKSHGSEIRLARFLINYLSAGDHFIDIGAHYGYFTLLAATIVAEHGKVFAFEPAKDTFRILSKNCHTKKNIRIFNEAVSDENGTLTFFQFPNMYSEYNSLDIHQFENEDWYQSNKPEKITVNAQTLDSIVNQQQIKASIIKIDVEGAEDKTIGGGVQFFTSQNPYIVMEYLSAERGNESHQKAAKQLQDLGYSSFVITENGHLKRIENIDGHLASAKTDSENIIFKRL